jgi:hypothetical protein
MGCIPSIPLHHAAPVGPLFPDDDTTWSSIAATNERSMLGSTCPHHSAISHPSSSPRRTSPQADTQPPQPQERCYYPDRPVFLSVFIQSMLILVGVAYLGWFLFNKLKGPVETIVKVYEMVVASLSGCPEWRNILFGVWKKSDVTWLITRKPQDWWDTEKVDWDGNLKLDFVGAVLTMGMFVMDLLFSSEAKQGNSFMLAPLFLFCLVYAVLSIHAQASHLLKAEIYLSFNTTKIGDEIFKKPQMVFMIFTHLFALDLGLVFVMMRDFYSRVSSRRMEYRLIMVAIVLGTMAQGLSTVPIYLILRLTLFKSPQIRPQNLLRSNRNGYKREHDYLLDPIPRGDAALSGWVQLIPSPLNLPVFVLVVAVGIIRFLLALGVYFTYVTFFCLPLSAIFFSIRRSWKLLFGSQNVQGALFSPFDTVGGKVFPLKGVLVVSAHLRLICFVNKRNVLFNATIGWWLRRLLEAAMMYEFTLPFKGGFTPYVEFLMSEFGPVFPIGQGLGFGSHEHVKAIIENPDQRKAGTFAGWAISSAQYRWSKNQLTNLPQKEIDKSIVAEGRQIVECWLQEVNDKLKNELVRKRLDAILPFANLDGTMVDKKLVESAFGSTLFHLLTDGDFTKQERHKYHRLLTNGFAFFSDLINKIWFGGIMEYTAIRDYGEAAFVPLQKVQCRGLR